MSNNLYTPRNIFSIATHYGATAAIAAGSLLVGGPWLMGAAVLITGGISTLVIREQKKYLENNLVQHPDIHEFSPRLGKTADELYAKSGLKAEGNPIYDFRADKDKTAQKPRALDKLFEKLFDVMAQTHNAAALKLGKPVIMISEPLLKLLNDEEEKAVLAHEFAHAAAHHQHIGMPQKLLAGVAGTTNGLAMIGAFWMAGWRGMLTGVVAGVGSALLLKKVCDNDGILSAKDDTLSLSELAKKKKITTAISTASSLVTAGVLTLFNPMYLALYAATKVMSGASKVITGAFSRSLEYQADRGAVKLGGDPLALITSLRKMTIVAERSKKEAFGGELPKSGALTKAWRKATASHPTLDNRIARLAKVAKKQGISEEFISKAVSGPIEVAAEHNMSYSVIKQLAHAV